MLRQLLLKTATRAKADGFVDSFMRYNPLLQRRVMQCIHNYREGAQKAGEPAHSLTDTIIKAARATRYGAGKPQGIAQWPVLEKELLRARPRDFINPRNLIRIPCGTGGTSGIPLKLWRSLESIVAEQLFIDELLAPHGLSMRSKMAVLRADNVKLTSDTAPPFGRITHGGQRLTLSSPHLNADTVGWFHDAITRFEPSILWVYPSAAGNLLTLCERAGLRLKIPVILASSEMLSASAHRNLESYFESNVINYYGQAERVCLAVSTKPNEFYFNPCYGRVEFGKPEPYDNSESAVRIIGTNYWNQAMPLIRYNTGDMLYIPKEYGAAELNEIALGKRPFTGMAGREGEYLLTRDGMRIIGLNQIPREISHVLQFQLVQTDYDDVVINVIAMPGFNDKDVREIEEHARSKMPPSIRITVRRTERLQTTSRGKTPLVVRNLPATEL